MDITKFLASADNKILEKLRRTRSEEELITIARADGYDFTYTEARDLHNLMTNKLSEQDMINVVCGTGAKGSSNGYCSMKQRDVLMIGTPHCEQYIQNDMKSQMKSCNNCVHFTSQC